MSGSRLPWRARFAKQMPPGQFARYLMVGAWNTVFGYSLYALFTALLMPRVRFGYIYASVASNLIAITVAYFCYKIFIFKTRGNYWAEWMRCILVYGSALLPGLLLLPLLVEGLHYGFHLGRSAPYVGGVLWTGMTVIYSFFGHKNFSFRVAGNVGRNAVTTDVEPPAEGVAERLIVEPATKAAKRV
ncbi:MAG: GtrA family protein [Acidobacteriaceae bacterium]